MRGQFPKELWIFFAKRDDGKHLERKLAEAWTRQEMGGKRIEYFEPEIAMKAIDERETKLVGTGGLPSLNNFAILNWVANLLNRYLYRVVFPTLEKSRFWTKYDPKKHFTDALCLFTRLLI